MLFQASEYVTIRKYAKVAMIFNFLWYVYLIIGFNFMVVYESKILVFRNTFGNAYADTAPYL